MSALSDEASSILALPNVGLDTKSVIRRQSAEIERLRAALTKISEIELQEYGPDYAEIEQAQIIATAVLAFQQQLKGKRT